MSVRAASREAYDQIKADGRLSERQRDVMLFMHSLPKGTMLYRREIAQFSKIPINVICPRVLELIGKGYLEEEEEKTVDPVTGAPAHRVKVKRYEMQAELALS
jgi:hypothetical protein